MRTTTVAALMLALTASSTMATAQPARRDGNARGAVAREANTRDANTRGVNMRGRGEQSPAAALLRQRERLGLTAEQTKQLETLAAEQREAFTGAPSQQLRLRADLLDATRTNFNPTAARAALDKLSDARNARIVAGMQAREQARAVLTPEQLSKVALAHGARGGMRAGNAGDRGRRAQAPGARQGRPPQGGPAQGGAAPARPLQGPRPGRG